MAGLSPVLPIVRELFTGVGSHRVYDMFFKRVESWQAKNNESGKPRTTFALIYQGLLQEHEALPNFQEIYDQSRKPIGIPLNEQCTRFMTEDQLIEALNKMDDEKTQVFVVGFEMEKPTPLKKKALKKLEKECIHSQELLPLKEFYFKFEKHIRALDMLNKNNVSEAISHISAMAKLTGSRSKAKAIQMWTEYEIKDKFGVFGDAAQKSVKWSLDKIKEGDKNLAKILSDDRVHASEVKKQIEEIKKFG
jgi:hypothetical protein